MAQDLLVEVQTRVTKLKEMEEQMEKLQKQISEKEQEIRNFYQEWKNNCPHVFYRVQRLVVCTTSTVGYYCCLCGTYQRAQYPKATPTIHSLGSSNYRQKRHERVRIPINSQADINAPNFIGTVIESCYAPASYPIPPEYQAKVDSKNQQLRRLKDEKSALEKKLEDLETSIKIFKTELNEIAHLLNGYFHYPETVYRERHHWGPDDFNYDPFD